MKPKGLKVVGAMAMGRNSVGSSEYSALMNYLPMKMSASHSRVKL